MPRQSIPAQATRVDGKPSRLAPRPGCSEAVAGVFRDLVASVATDHFTTADAPLLESYAEAIALSRLAYAELEKSGPVVNGKTSPWIVVQEKAHRSQVALSARLRLCPQSRFDRTKAGKTARDSRVPSIDWSET
jgi:phage terminase small subunit